MITSPPHPLSQLNRKEAAVLVGKATKAMVDALCQCDVALNYSDVMDGSIGALVGCVAKSAEDPDKTLANIIRVARGIMDGSLSKS